MKFTTSHNDLMKNWVCCVIYGGGGVSTPAEYIVNHINEHNVLLMRRRGSASWPSPFEPTPPRHPGCGSLASSGDGLIIFDPRPADEIRLAFQQAGSLSRPPTDYSICTAKLTQKVSLADSGGAKTTQTQKATNAYENSGNLGRGGEEEIRENTGTYRNSDILCQFFCDPVGPFTDDNQNRGRLVWGRSARPRRDLRQGDPDCFCQIPVCSAKFPGPRGRERALRARAREAPPGGPSWRALLDISLNKPGFGTDEEEEDSTGLVLVS
jgi:hypothetical protein